MPGHSKRYAEPDYDDNNEKARTADNGKDPKSSKKAAEITNYLDFVASMDKVKGVDQVLERGQQRHDAGKEKRQADEPYREFAEGMKKIESMDQIKASHEQALKRRGR